MSELVPTIVITIGEISIRGFENAGEFSGIEIHFPEDTIVVPCKSKDVILLVESYVKLINQAARLGSPRTTCPHVVQYRH